MATHIFIIGSNDSVHRGEVANVVALSQPLIGRTDLTVHTFKIPGAPPPEKDNQSSIVTVSSPLEYHKLAPVYGPEILAPAIQSIATDDRVIVLGGGHSTLHTVAELTRGLRTHGHTIEAGWTTHMVEQPHEITLLVQDDVTLFAPLWIEDGARQLPGGEHMRFVGLKGMPTGNDLSSLQADRDRFIKHNPTGQAFYAYAYPDNAPPRPYIVVIANAGFRDENGVFNSIRPAERYLQGKALGGTVSSGLTLLYVHGGPRNIQEEDVLHAQYGDIEMPTDAFIRGYREAQQVMGGTPEIFIDRFPAKDNMPPIRTNSANSTIALSHDDNCIAAISSDEGEGTKSDALMYGKSGKFYLLPSSLVDRDPSGQRQASRNYYAVHGMPVLTLDANGHLPPLHNIHSDAVPFVFDKTQLPGPVCLRYYGLIA